jgi:hypothetical protein
MIARSSDFALMGFGLQYRPQANGASLCADRGGAQRALTD